jgi:hypothetical protein
MQPARADIIYSDGGTYSVSSAVYDGFYIYNNSTLNILDNALIDPPPGSFSAESPVYASNGNIYMSGGTLIASGEDKVNTHGYAMSLRTGSYGEISGGELITNSNRLDGYGPSDNLLVYDGSHATVSGGIFSRDVVAGSVFMVDVNSTMTISGGNFTASAESRIGYVRGGSSLDISGGIFNSGEWNGGGLSVIDTSDINFIGRNWDYHLLASSSGSERYLISGILNDENPISIVVNTNTYRGSSGTISFNGVPTLGGFEAPIPASIWLFFSGLLGLIGIARRAAPI